MEEVTDAPEPAGTDGAETVPWLDSQQINAWKALMGLVMTLPVALDAQLKRDAGLNAFEYHVMASLAEAPGRTRMMSELAVQARGSLSRLSHAVSRLERDGWVERRSCGGAGRRTEARLTDQGWEKIQEAAPGHVREARRLVVDTLSAEQLTALGEAARKVVAVTDPVIAEMMERDRCGGC